MLRAFIAIQLSDELKRQIRKRTGRAETGGLRFGTGRHPQAAKSLRRISREPASASEQPLLLHDFTEGE